MRNSFFIECWFNNILPSAYNNYCMRPSSIIALEKKNTVKWYIAIFKVVLKLFYFVYMHEQLLIRYYNCLYNIVNFTSWNMFITVYIYMIREKKSEKSMHDQCNINNKFLVILLIWYFCINEMISVICFFLFSPNDSS